MKYPNKHTPSAELFQLYLSLKRDMIELERFKATQVNLAGMNEQLRQQNQSNTAMYEFTIRTLEEKLNALLHPAPPAVKQKIKVIQSR